MSIFDVPAPTGNYALIELPVDTQTYLQNGRKMPSLNDSVAPGHIIPFSVWYINCMSGKWDTLRY